MAIDQCAAWRSAPALALGMAVEPSSPRNLVDHELPQQIQRMLDERGLPTTVLELELTEGTRSCPDPQARPAEIPRPARRGWACGWRSTTSAPATRPSPT